MELFVSLVIGGVIGWAITHMYARQSSAELRAENADLRQRLGRVQASVDTARELQATAQQLRDESRQLRNLTNTLAHHLEDAGLIEADWDEDGNLTRFIRLEATGIGSATGSGNLTVQPGPAPIE